MLVTVAKFRSLNFVPPLYKLFEIYLFRLLLDLETVHREVPKNFRQSECYRVGEVCVMDEMCEGSVI